MDSEHHLSEFLSLSVLAPVDFHYIDISGNIAKGLFGG